MVSCLKNTNHSVPKISIHVKRFMHRKYHAYNTPTYWNVTYIIPTSHVSHHILQAEYASVIMIMAGIQY